MVQMMETHQIKSPSHVAQQEMLSWLSVSMLIRFLDPSVKALTHLLSQSGRDLPSPCVLKQQHVIWKFVMVISSITDLRGTEQIVCNSDNQDDHLVVLISAGS